MIDITNQAVFRQYLRERKLIDGDAPLVLSELKGGVSCDVFRVEAGSVSFVVKQARPKLRVKEDWFSDTARIAIEKDGLLFYQSVVPELVPHFVFYDPDNHLFGMEAAPAQARMWKAALLAGTVDLSVGRRTGEALARVHNAAAADPVARQTFASQKFFIELRIDPYLRTIAERHADLRGTIETEIDRLLSNRQTLVHGDYSPKNILMADDRLFILDFEVAHIGDPSFDLGFLTTHFMLKAVKHKQWAPAYLGLMTATAGRYLDTVRFAGRDEIERNSVRTLALLFLARVDGKSPAEYLTEAADQAFIRDISRRLIGDGLSRYADLAQLMARELTRRGGGAIDRPNDGRAQ